jgi:hypothetical protein
MTEDDLIVLAARRLLDEHHELRELFVVEAAFYGRYRRRFSVPERHQHPFALGCREDLDAGKALFLT